LPAGTARVAWVKGIAVGDRIMIGSAGADRALEVVDLHELPAEIKKLGKVAMSSHLVLVTAREQAAPGAPLVRFIVDAETFGTSIKTATGPDVL
jgi:hypothetical protein